MIREIRSAEQLADLIQESHSVSSSSPAPQATSSR